MVHLRRGWWKPWNWSTRTWLLAIIASTLISPIVIRWCCLWTVSDVKLPFDPESLLTDEPLADQELEQVYTAIYAKVEQQQNDWLWNAVVDGAGSDPEWDSRLDQWLPENADLLDELERATRLPAAKAFSRNLLRGLESARDDRVWRFAFRLARTVAVHHLREGRLDDAWRWHKASLQLAHQVDAPGTSEDYVHAKAMYSTVYMLTERWAANASLTPEQLSVAREDIRRFDAARTKLSDLMKAAYIKTEGVAKQPDVADVLYPQWQMNPRIELLEPTYKRAALWMFGEPGISLRYFRQVLMNNLEQLDRPLPQRARELRADYPIVFDDEGTTRVPGQMSGAQLKKMLDGPLGRHLVEIDWFFWIGEARDSGWLRGGMETIHLRCQAETRMIDVVLAAHQYQREHGEFPANLNQLVPGYLPSVPVDPTSRTGLPLQYRPHDSKSAMILYADDSGSNLTGGNDEAGPRYRIFLSDKNPAATEPQ